MSKIVIGDAAGKPLKQRKHCFCRSCYYALPEPMRSRLWIHTLSVGALLEWAENYQDAQNHLREVLGNGGLVA